MRRVLLGSLLLALWLAGSACDGGGSATPPAAPTNVQALSGDGQVTLQWRVPAAVEGVNVYRATSSFSSVEGRSPVNSAAVTQSSYTDANVTNGTTYYYGVVAVGSGGATSELSTVVAVTPIPTPPSRP